MNLLQTRKEFRKISGRFDLVNEDGSDNGADFFLNEGRKFLDRLDETQKSWASCFRFVEIGGFSASFPHCRAVKEVWAMSSTARWQLEKKDLQDMITGYMSGLPSSRTNGTPLYYSPCLTRYIPEDALVADIESFVGWVDVPAGGAHEYNAVLINVPTDVRLSLDIKGLYYSMELVDETDTNFWSGAHPMLLIMAGMRALEIVNRNTQGVKDWEASIRTDVTGLGMDLVEELISEVTQIED